MPRARTSLSEGKHCGYRHAPRPLPPPTHPPTHPPTPHTHPVCVLPTHPPCVCPASRAGLHVVSLPVGCADDEPEDGLAAAASCAPVDLTFTSAAGCAAVVLDAVVRRDGGSLLVLAADGGGRVRALVAVSGGAALWSVAYSCELAPDALPPAPRWGGDGVGGAWEASLQARVRERDEAATGGGGPSAGKEALVPQYVGYLFGARFRMCAMRQPFRHPTLRVQLCAITQSRRCSVLGVRGCVRACGCVLRARRLAAPRFPARWDLHSVWTCSGGTRVP